MNTPIEIYLLMEDSDQTMHSQPMPNGFAVATEEEAKKWEARTFKTPSFMMKHEHTYRKVTVYSSVDEILEIKKSTAYKSRL